MAVTVANYCPSRMVEHPKSKSTQPRFATRWVTLYVSSFAHCVSNVRCGAEQFFVMDEEILRNARTVLSPSISMAVVPRRKTERQSFSRNWLQVEIVSNGAKGEGRWV